MSIIATQSIIIQISNLYILFMIVQEIYAVAENEVIIVMLMGPTILKSIFIMSFWLCRVAVTEGNYELRTRWLEVLG